MFFLLCSTVVRWLALLSHCKKVRGSNLRSSLSVWSLHDIPVHVCTGLNLKRDCLIEWASLCVSPAIAWQPIQGVTP